MQTLLYYLDCFSSLLDMAGMRAFVQMSCGGAGVSSILIVIIV